MQEVVLVIHLILTISLVVMVLIQRSSGGALGIGGGQGGMMAGRSSATMLTRITTYLAIAFFATSLGLAVIAKQQTKDSSIFDVEEKVIKKTEPAPKTEPVIPDSN